MPACAVTGCPNSSTKKFKMNSIPRDPVQRALWIKSIGRPNWVPSNYAVVCEVHFAPEMWEKTRVDGTRKLKRNAVPTLFGNRIVKESPNVHAAITPVRNQNDTNIQIPNQQTVIQISPSVNRLNLQQAPLVIPVSEASSANFKPLSNNSKMISILKPELKIKSLKPTVLANSSTLTNEKVINENQKKIIISNNSDSSETKLFDSSGGLLINDINVPDDTEVETDSAQSALKSTIENQVINLNGSEPIINTSTTGVIQIDDPSVSFHKAVDTANNSNCLKTQIIDLTGSLPTINVNTPNVTETKINDRQSVLFPVSVDSVNSKTEIINLEKPEKSESRISKTINKNIEKLETLTSTMSENVESANQPESGKFVSTGIILNKAEAKKIEDERFEKMDKLLMKQLKLNDALRKKLGVLRRKMQRITNQDKKLDFGSTSFLKNVFTDDQIRVLQLRHSNSKSITTWSDDTMLKAIKLKKACGLRGYEEILKQNLPYPSIKTITRWCNARAIEIP